MYILHITLAKRKACPVCEIAALTLYKGIFPLTTQWAIEKTFAVSELVVVSEIDIRVTKVDLFALL